MVAARPGRVHVAGVEQDADLVQRCGDVAVVLAREARLALLVPVETDHASHGRALPGAVGTEEAGHPAGLDVERQVVDRHHLTEPLREVAYLQHADIRPGLSLIHISEPTRRTPISY